MTKVQGLVSLACTAMASRDFQLAESHLRKAIVIIAFGPDRSEMQEVFSRLIVCMVKQNNDEEAQRLEFFARQCVSA